jgi:hypothetical protein
MSARFKQQLDEQDAVVGKAVAQKHGRRHAFAKPAHAALDP